MGFIFINVIIIVVLYLLFEVMSGHFCTTTVYAVAKSCFVCLLAYKVGLPTNFNLKCKLQFKSIIKLGAIFL